jgi:hypothetical protein
VISLIAASLKPRAPTTVSAARRIASRVASPRAVLGLFLAGSVIDMKPESVVMFIQPQALPAVKPARRRL